MYIVVPILKFYKIVKIPVRVLKSSRTCILIVQNILCFPAFWTILIVYMPGIVERARSQKRPKIFRTTYMNLLKWCIFFRDRTSTITSLGPLIMDIISITPRSNSSMCRSTGGDPFSRENENVLNLHIKIIAHTCMPRTPLLPPPPDEEFHD